MNHVKQLEYIMKLSAHFMLFVMASKKNCSIYTEMICICSICGYHDIVPHYYIMANFVQNHKTEPLHLICDDKVWVVFCEFIVWFMFIHCKIAYFNSVRAVACELSYHTEMLWLSERQFWLYHVKFSAEFAWWNLGNTSWNFEIL